MLVGTSTWRELYFGTFTNTDYFGTYMPKPWAAAYANLIRRFDGFKESNASSKYDEDEFGSLRVFDVKLKDDEAFKVMWSNIYMLPNTTAIGGVKRTPREAGPVWENRWLQTEVREFDAVGDTVTVIDIMGNSKTLKTENGKIKIEISGSPIYVYGVC